ncbi:MAG: glycosyltransferase [Brevibacterium sp.]|nr:glycosyltransferase [Brevibacterium sp.]
MTSSSIVPPLGDIVSVYWTIADDYGGMTKVMLRRTTMLASAWGRKAQLLLLSGNTDMDEVRTRLDAEESFGKKIKVRNPWEELSTASDRKLRKLVGEEVEDPRSIDDTLAYSGQSIAERTNDDEAVMQTDRFRANGSVYLSHRRDMRKRGKAGGARITLFDRRGNVLAEWSNATRFYHAWIDYVIGAKPAYLFSDSNFVGPMLADYRRDHVTTVQTLHSAHLSPGGDALTSSLHPATAKLSRIMDRFDAMVTLTPGQEQDLLAAGIASNNLHVVPNSQPVFPGGAQRPRPKTSGVLIARLEPDKRVDHGLTALASTPASLDVFGNGSQQELLEELARGLEIDNRVRFHGYVSGVMDRYLGASFSVLCSEAEGQGLVLLESMAAGCIPIAYDVRYGPASIITDGVDGFLVPPGNTDALSTAIEQVSSLDDRRLTEMRQAAIRRAHDYSDSAVIESWAKTLESAQTSKRPVVDVECTAQLTSAETASEQFVLSLDVSTPEQLRVDEAWVAWNGRDNGAYGRVEAHSTGSGSYRAELPVSRLDGTGEGLLDLYVDTRIEGNPYRSRLAVKGADLPEAIGHCQIYTTKFGNVSVRVTVD